MKVRNPSIGVTLVLASLWLGCSGPAPSDAASDIPQSDMPTTGDGTSPDASVDDVGRADAAADAGPMPVGPVGAIRIGRLIDPQDGSVITGAVVVIENGRVSYVGTDASRIPATATVLDWRAFTAVPGLVDTHVHFSFMTDNAPGTYPWTHLGDLSPDELLGLARTAARATLRIGVTTAVDKGSFQGVAERLRDEIAAGTTPGPRLFIAGPGIWQAPTGGFHGVDAIRAEVRRLIMDVHVDLIKLYADACSDERLTCAIRFTPEELRAAVDEAHRLNTPVSIHAYHGDGAESVIQAGPDTLEHAEGLTAAQLTALVERNVTYIPTIDHNRYYRDNIRAFGYAPELYAEFTDYIQHNLETATAAHARGVHIATGSDAVFSGFGQNTGEINWLVQTGMTPLQVLQSATTVGAATVRQQHQIGRVAQGFYADLVAVDGDPLMDPRVLVTRVRGVVRGGVAIDLAASH
jgi:imidazolonepropionase-like amidohydrolase